MEIRYDIIDEIKEDLNNFTWFYENGEAFISRFKIIYDIIPTDINEFHMHKFEKGYKYEIKYGEEIKKGEEIEFNTHSWLLYPICFIIDMMDDENLKMIGKCYKIYNKIYGDMPVLINDKYYYNIIEDMFRAEKNNFKRFNNYEHVLRTIIQNIIKKLHDIIVEEEEN